MKSVSVQVGDVSYEEFNKKEKSKHVTTESEHVEAVALELVVPSHQEAINKVIVDTTAEVVNEPQETMEDPVLSPSTPPALEDLKNWNTDLNLLLRIWRLMPLPGVIMVLHRV
ncbi:hypothetical protein L1987_06734 [Smallanthus sonchifolius]|uniref:Uncharacterized protein n=1 Tax=Smallanthus sonchifolius TaxID=185202 RepID=A0ACB9JYY5_9ASTR|nr:hypothetical protein L1987_06734 [Smallanthus sonchifolius]